MKNDILVKILVNNYYYSRPQDVQQGKISI